MSIQAVQTHFPIWLSKIPVHRNGIAAIPKNRSLKNNNYTFILALKHVQNIFNLYIIVWLGTSVKEEKLRQHLTKATVHLKSLALKSLNKFVQNLIWINMVQNLTAISKMHSAIISVLQLRKKSVQHFCIKLKIKFYILFSMKKEANFRESVSQLKVCRRGDSQTSGT